MEEVGAMKKITDDKREKVIALYSAGESYSEIAQATKVSKTSVAGIIKQYRESNPDECERIRTEKRTEYIEEASEVVKGLFTLIGRRVKTLLDHENALDDIVDIVADYDGSDKFKNNLISKMSGLLCPKLTELTTSMGITYDKLLLMMERNGSDADGGGVVEVTQTITIKPPEDDGEDDE